MIRKIGALIPITNQFEIECNSMRLHIVYYEMKILWYFFAIKHNEYALLYYENLIALIST